MATYFIFENPEHKLVQPLFKHCFVFFAVRPRKVNFLFLVNMQVDFVCVVNRGLGMSTKVWGQAGNEYKDLRVSLLRTSSFSACTCME